MYGDGCICFMEVDTGTGFECTALGIGSLENAMLTHKQLTLVVLHCPKAPHHNPSLSNSRRLQNYKMRHEFKRCQSTCPSVPTYICSSYEMIMEK